MIKYNFQAIITILKKRITPMINPNLIALIIIIKRSKN